jgi:tetratricopeptide (TPR) repeat protein
VARGQSSDHRKFALTNWSDALLVKKLYGQTAEKCREAIAVDPDYPNAYNLLGLALAAQELFEEAIAQYSKADTLWQKAGSTDRKFALCNWGRVLGGQERFEDAVAKYALAIKVAPEDASAFFNYGNGLAACRKIPGCNRTVRQSAALLDREDPLSVPQQGAFFSRLAATRKVGRSGGLRGRGTRACLSAGLIATGSIRK